MGGYFMNVKSSYSGSEFKIDEYNNYQFYDEINYSINELIDKIENEKNPKIKLFEEDLFNVNIDSNIELDFNIDLPKTIEICYF